MNCFTETNSGIGSNNIRNLKMFLIELLLEIFPLLYLMPLPKAAFFFQVGHLDLQTINGVCEEQFSCSDITSLLVETIHYQIKEELH